MTKEQAAVQYARVKELQDHYAKAHEDVVSAAPQPAGPVWVKCEQCDGDGYTLNQASNSGATESNKCIYCNGAGKYEIGAWAPVSENKPPHWDSVLLRRIDSKKEIDFSEIIKFKDDYIELENYNANWGERIYYSNIEWSPQSESAPQVFTRENMKHLHDTICSYFNAGEKDQAFDHYMDTNYPTP